MPPLYSSFPEASPAGDEGMPSPFHVAACPVCRLEHRRTPLQPGQRSLCTRCGSILAKRGWFGDDAALAFGVTGLVLALPAIVLPFVTVSKLHTVKVTHLVTGSAALWNEGMRLLAIWVFLCGTLAPVLLLVTLIGHLGPVRLGWTAPPAAWLRRAAHALEHWAMPEVHVLAVLVSLIKLGTLVGVAVGPGFWCYVAMSFAILVAWRSFDFSAPARSPTGGDS